MIRLQPGERVLWLATQFVLDDKNGVQASDWYPAVEDYLDFGDCNQARFDFKVWMAGLAYGSVMVDVERTTQLELGDQFEPMNSVAQSLSQGGGNPGLFSLEFGRGSTTPADKFPRGLGRLHVYNNDAAAGHLCSVHMEVWVAGQQFTAAGR